MLSILSGKKINRFKLQASLKMHKLLLILPVVFNIAFAATITIENQNLECNRTQDKREAYLCKKDNQEIFVTNGGYGYSGYLKDSSGKFEVKTVSKLVADEKVIYEIPNYPGLGGMMGGMVFKMPDTVSNRKMMATVIADNLKQFTSPIAKDLVTGARKFIEESKTPEKIKFKTKNGDFNCNASQTRELSAEEKKAEELYKTKIGCNYFVCKDATGKEALGFFSGDTMSFAGPSLLILDPKGKEDIVTSDLSIEANEGNLKGLNLYQAINPFAGGMGFPGGNTSQPMTMQSMYPNTDNIDMNDYLPKKIKERSSLYNYLGQPGSAETVKYNASLCVGDEVSRLIKKQETIVDEFNNVILDENLTQLVSLMNGQLMGTFMPTDNIKKYGCLYNGVVISPKALAHFNYIKKLNENPNQSNYLSPKEVQDLFLKAKEMKDIPFGYKYDGCYARAHVMARRFEAMGIPTEKVWIKGDLSVPGTDIRWNFHVAPVVTVKDPTDGLPKKYVIDPSLTDKAVPLDEWVATMKPNVRGPIVKTAYPIPLNAANMERTAVAISSSDPYLPNGDMSMNEDQIMAMSKKTMEEYSKYVK